MMKNKWDPGQDDIVSCTVEANGKTILQWLTCLDQTVWKKDKVPEDWVIQLTIPTRVHFML